MSREFWIAIVLLVSLCAQTVTAEVVRLSEPTAQDAHTETFGQVWGAELPRMSLSQALAQSEHWDLSGQASNNLVVGTRIGKVWLRKR